MVMMLVSLVQAEESKDISALRAKAEAGDATAQNNLGASYDNGDGVIKDAAEAVKLYRKAAE